MKQVLDRVVTGGLLICLALLLGACIPSLIGVSDLVALERTDVGVYKVTAKVGPTLLVNSSVGITSWLPAKACVAFDKIKNEVTGLRCAISSVPFTVAFTTSSRTPNVQIVDGIKPVTGLVTAAP